jgi:hypothetical protein
MSVDVLYLCHGRLEFTKASLQTLIAHTDWSPVNEFVVYHDASTSAWDGDDVSSFLEWASREYDLTVRHTNLQSPVAVMKHFLARSNASMFAKVDNDIVVPPGWLAALVSVMEVNPELELLGMEAGMSARKADVPGERTWTPSSHIGGVGLMRHSAFKHRPPLVPDGRFGFTEWQHEYGPVRGWIEPDIRMFALDQLPIEPWVTITEQYRSKGLNREWPKYDPAMSFYWDWWV